MFHLIATAINEVLFPIALFAGVFSVLCCWQYDPSRLPVQTTATIEPPAPAPVATIKPPAPTPVETPVTVASIIATVEPVTTEAVAQALPDSYIADPWNIATPSVIKLATPQMPVAVAYPLALPPAKEPAKKAKRTRKPKAKAVA